MMRTPIDQSQTLPVSLTVTWNATIDVTHVTLENLSGFWI